TRRAARPSRPQPAPVLRAGGGRPDRFRYPHETMSALNETHDPALKSWVPSANGDDTGFPIQNLPYAVFRRRGRDEAWRPGVAIGSQIVDLAALAAQHPFEGEAAQALAACTGTTLNALMALGQPAWSAL